MHLDVQTLSVVTVFITALLGALLVFAGLQNRSIRAPMWWGAAHIVNAGRVGAFDLARRRARFLHHRSRQCARAARLRSDLDRRARVRWPRDPAVPGAACAGRSGCCSAACRRFAADVNLRVVVVSTTAGGAGAADGGGVLARTRRAADVALAFGHRAARLCGGAARARAGDAADAGVCRRFAVERAVVRAARLRHAAVHGGHGVSSAQHDQGAHRAEATRSIRWSIR